MAINFPEFDNIKYRVEVEGGGTRGLYPQEILELGVADSGVPVPYLDVLIKYNTKLGLHTAVYDKRMEPKFLMILFLRYPEMFTVLDTSCKLNVITSQMHRYMTISSILKDFVYQTSLVIHRMVLKGYIQAPLLRMCKRFLHGRFLYRGTPETRIIKLIRAKLRELQEGHIVPGVHGQLQPRRDL